MRIYEKPFFQIIILEGKDAITTSDDKDNVRGASDNWEGWNE